MPETVTSSANSATTLYQQLLDDLADALTIIHSEESVDATFGRAHGNIYATPHKGMLPNLTCEQLRAAVVHELGEALVNECCYFENELIDGEEERPSMTYTGLPHNMPAVFRGLRLAMTGEFSLEPVLTQVS